MKKRVMLVIAFVILTILSLATGVVDVNIKDLLSLDQRAWFIVFNSRLPRTVAIILTATSMSVSGLIMQTISKNKFVSPSVVGITDSAQLGILIAFVFFGSLSLTFKMVFSFLFAVLGAFVFMSILSRIKFKNAIYVPLVGMMFAGIIGSIVSFIAYQFNLTQFIQTFGIGSFSSIVSGNYELLYVVIVPLMIGFIYMVQFNIIGVGEDFAKNLGVNYQKTLMVGLVVISLITASTYVVVGSIPFIGLVVPNLISLYYGDNLKKTIFDVSLFGSVFVLFADIFSRLIIYPYEIPISLTMGVIGSVVFLFLIYRRVNHA
ncbi:MAG: iron chelate uptake ABC transporter family permease subunit [Paracholeplasma sp.]|nr:iron chelate uptake ABC transporter family permease subunit [Paracholeplasma sp.]MDY3195237.1 iron chelate uptake ABC transporter family permease subunit [Paracholeplasma sp.]